MSTASGPSFASAGRSAANVGTVIRTETNTSTIGLVMSISGTCRRPPVSLMNERIGSTGFRMMTLGRPLYCFDRRKFAHGCRGIA